MKTRIDLGAQGVDENDLKNNTSLNVPDVDIVGLDKVDIMPTCCPTCNKEGSYKNCESNSYEDT